MKYKQIESSREIRLWITQIMVPSIVIAGMWLKMNPSSNFTCAVKSKYYNIKDKVKTKFSKS